jgi:hypothetical protein
VVKEGSSPCSPLQEGRLHACRVTGHHHHCLGGVVQSASSVQPLQGGRLQACRMTDHHHHRLSGGEVQARNTVPPRSGKPASCLPDDWPPSSSARCSSGRPDPVAPILEAGPGRAWARAPASERPASEGLPGHGLPTQEGRVQGVRGSCPHRKARRFRRCPPQLPT